MARHRLSSIRPGQSYRVVKECHMALPNLIRGRADLIYSKRGMNIGFPKSNASPWPEVPAVIFQPIIQALKPGGVYVDCAYYNPYQAGRYIELAEHAGLRLRKTIVYMGKALLEQRSVDDAKPLTAFVLTR